MKRLLSVLGWGVLFVALLAVTALVFSTYRGSTTWYFRVDGVVMIDGNKTTGYLHANSERTLLLLTRTDQPKNETYLVPVRDNSLIFDCGEWNPMRFIPMPVGDLSSVCSPSIDPARIRDAPVTSSVVRGRRSVAFSTVSGRKVVAEW